MCIVCKHNQVKDLDRALLTGASLTSLSKKYGFSTSDLDRHHQHLVHKMAQAQKRFHDGLHQGLFCKLNIVMEMVLGVVRGARAGEDFKLFLQASRELTRLISLMIKMDVHLEPEMIYCLMASPQWDLQDSLLPNSFQALSQTRQTLAVNLFAPCPDPEPETIPATAQCFPFETQNSKLETSHPADFLADPNPALLQSVHPTWARQPDTEPNTANPPKTQREISAKNRLFK
jgi:hypothetical protein